MHNIMIHVDPMQVGELLDLHQHISFPVFYPFPSRIPSSDLRKNRSSTICILLIQTSKYA